MPTSDRGQWRGIGSLVRLLVRASPARHAANAAAGLIADSLVPLAALGLRMLTQGIVRGDVGHAVAGGAFMAACSVAVDGLYWTGMVLQISLLERVGRAVDDQLMRLAGEVSTIEHLERSDYYDRVALLRDEQEDLAQFPVAVVRVVSIAVRSAITLVLLGSIHPVLLLLPVFGLPSMFIARRGGRSLLAALEKVAPEQRKSTALFDLATATQAAKDIRIFGLDRAVVEKHRDVWRSLDGTLGRVERRNALRAGAGWAVFSMGFVAAAAFVVDRAVHGQATPGDVALTLMLASQVNASLSYAVTTVGWLQYSVKCASRYLWLAHYTEAALAKARPVRPAPVPDRLDSGIELRGVGFSYPGTDVPILRDIDLHLPAGSTVAVVGENGAGKTTLVKLLCRLYDPTEGQVLVEGCDAASFEPAAWSARISVALQDHVRFELLAQETVGIGDLGRLDREPVVLTALERAAASDVLGALPDGLGTQLGRSFDGGIELSGGQWQKLTLGRAMMRDRPLLLILDEPTASLDAHTEHALFERFTSAAASTARLTGAVTILVSHRFSTVRMADLIVVLQHGRVIEVGGHVELMRQGGLYAELYELQAQAYR